MITWVAVSLVPLMVSAGLATDIARGFVLRSELSAALDAAALAGGRVFNAENRDEIIEQYFDANFPEGFMDAEVGELQIEAVSEDGEPDRLRVSASANMPTLFMRVAGFQEFDVGTAAEVTRENLGLQLAMVLDHTGSMATNGKIGDLENASLKLIDILFGDEQQNDKLQIAVIPYSAAVNVGDLGDAFIDKTGIPSQMFTSGTDELRWFGCVLARDTNTSIDANSDPTVMEADAYDINLAPPSVGGKWKPYLYPHWYDNQYHNLTFATNSDPRDPGVNAASNLEGVPNSPAYRGGEGPAGELNWGLPNHDRTNFANQNKVTGPNIGCPARLLNFTSIKSELVDYIEANTKPWPRGGTVGSEGLAWGRRLLDPGEPFPNPVPYNDPQTIKTLIMMTDGRNEVYRHKLDDYDDKDGDGIFVLDSNGNGDNNDSGDRPKSDYTAYKRLEENRLGTTNRNEAARRINMRMAKICHQLKVGGVGGRDKVAIYTVIFGNVATDGSAASEDLRDLYRNCASKPSNAFLAPSGADLEAAFETIGNDLANLHLSR